MGKKHLIGDKPGCLIPAEDVDSKTPAQRRRSGRHGANRFATKHTKNQPDIRKDQARKEQARKGKAQKEDSREQGKPKPKGNNKPKHKQRSRA